MRGFLLGSLVLVGLYVAVQPEGARAAAQGGNWLVSGLRRALSPEVAGVPQKRMTVDTASMSGSRSIT